MLRFFFRRKYNFVDGVSIGVAAVNIGEGRFAIALLVVAINSLGSSLGERALAKETAAHLTTSSEKAA